MGVQSRLPDRTSLRYLSKLDSSWICARRASSRPSSSAGMSSSSQFCTQQDLEVRHMADDHTASQHGRPRDSVRVCVQCNTCSNSTGRPDLHWVMGQKVANDWPTEKPCRLRAGSDRHASPAGSPRRGRGSRHVQLQPRHARSRRLLQHSKLVHACRARVVSSSCWL